MKLKSKLFAGAVGVAMVLSTVAIPASAQTTAELTAQINSLLAMIAQLQAQIAGGGSSTGGAGVMFTKDLTIGSTGSDVTALQQWLVSKGYLVMPAGVAMGYFGNLTKTALAKYQADSGISPASGYFGPITRAKANAMASTGGTTTGGTTTGGTTTGGATGITTPGAEGTISATQDNAGLVSTAYEGDSMVGILGIKLESKNSDMSVQRIKLRMDETTGGSDTKFYNKIYKKLYVTDGSNVLASADLNSSNVVKDGSNYYVTISGFNLVIPKDSKKTIVIKADLFPAIDSTDYDAEAYQLGVAANGIRAVDGAGIDQYAGGTSDSGIARTTTIAATLVDSSSLTMSLNTSSPKIGDQICSSGSNSNECDKLPILTFDLKAEKDNVKVTDINIQVTKTGAGGANASTTVYLYDGSTELDNATVVGTRAVFSDIDFIVPKDTTKTLTAKVDIRSANGTRAAFTGAASSTGTTAENSAGDSVNTKSGSATGFAQGVRSTGAEVTLVSKSITTNGVPQSSTSNTFSTSSLTATFNLKVKAVGGLVTLGGVASSAPLVASSTTSFKVYRNGSYDSTVGGAGTSTSFTIPTTCTTSGQSANSCLLSEGSEVTVPVTFQIFGRAANGTTMVSAGLYAVGVEGVQWSDENGAAQSTTFMAGESDWRTAEVAFP